VLLHGGGTIAISGCDIEHRQAIDMYRREDTVQQEPAGTYTAKSTINQTEISERTLYFRTRGVA
jgi:hypothetical protein